MYKYNFSPGPAKITESVLKIAKDNILEYNSEGISILELSHRSSSFQDIIDTTNDNLRKLLKIPSNFKILLLQGGATFQNTFIGHNVDKNKQLSNLVTGTWGNKSYEDIIKIRNTKKINLESAEVQAFLKQSNKKEFSPSEYLHVTSNETIEGVQIRNFDQINQNLIVDSSSDIGSYKFDWSNIVYLYAGAQKNLGIPGVTVCVIRDDFIIKNENPAYLNLKKLVDSDSLLNTPPTFSIYILKLLTDWMMQQGGLEYFEKQSIENSKAVYSLLEKYKEIVTIPVDEHSRSRMNIVFNFRNSDHEDIFINKSLESNIIGIKGHRSVGGIRISLYNSIDQKSLKYLLDFMNSFFKGL